MCTSCNQHVCIIFKLVRLRDFKLIANIIRWGGQDRNRLNSTGIRNMHWKEEITWLDATKTVSGF